MEPLGVHDLQGDSLPDLRARSRNPGRQCLPLHHALLGGQAR